jgi:hypothetical protein
LRVSALKYWVNISYAKSYLRKGLEALKNVCIQFLYQKETLESAKSTSKVKRPNSVGSAKTFTADEEFDNLQNEESLSFKRDKELDAEILQYSTLIADQNVIKSNVSTSVFWKEKRLEMPNLFKLSIILLNISSTSAFIGRIFSISGIVCENKRANMTDDLIVMRSMLKANMDILVTLTKIN